MCEPAHSIVQYPDKTDDDHDLPQGNMPMDVRIKKTLGERFSEWWGKHIGSWFHFSKVGNGHTSAISLTGKASLILPEHTRYEGLWWERKFILDGRFHGPKSDLADAFEAAKKYHETTVMGSMKQFRRFFEQSLCKTDRYASYIVRFVENCLNQKGREQLLKKARQLFGKTAQVECLINRRTSDAKKEQIIKFLMGFTRKRTLFLPHWSDDDKLWA